MARASETIMRILLYFQVKVKLNLWSRDQISVANIFCNLNFSEEFRSRDLREKIHSDDRIANVHQRLHGYAIMAKQRLVNCVEITGYDGLVSYATHFFTNP